MRRRGHATARAAWPSRGACKFGTFMQRGPWCCARSSLPVRACGSSRLRRLGLVAVRDCGGSRLWRLGPMGSAKSAIRRILLVCRFGLQSNPSQPENRSKPTRNRRFTIPPYLRLTAENTVRAAQSVNRLPCKMKRLRRSQYLRWNFGY